ncbi:MAG: patatin-like phospholipase family protein [Polyangiaceae bacterium]
MRALCLPGCGCRGAFQFGVMSTLAERGEQFDVVAGASSGSICGAVTVAGLASEGPAMFRSLASTKIVSRQYLRSEGSPFGMGAILRDALTRFVPEALVRASATELLVSTTRAGRLLRSALERARARLAPGRASSESYPFEKPSPVYELAVRAEARVIHSSRERTNIHDIIVASCTIPGLYAKLPVLDGEVHVDGGAADNTLLGVLLERGARDITVVTPYPNGAVSPTLFERTQTPRVPAGVRLRLLSPKEPLRLRHFDFDPGRLDEALEAPFTEEIID